MDNKQIFFGPEARGFILKGINLVADSVKTTLGYDGRVVIISESGMPSRTTKDGVTVANSIKVKDETTNAGAKMIKEISAKTADVVGDGTTTVCVLMQSMVNSGMDYIGSGANPVKIKKGMQQACKDVIESLQEMKFDVTNEYLKCVAAVSANNDEEIGAIISKAYEELGIHGIISVEDAKGPETYIEMIEGFQTNCGFYIHHFVNNPFKNTCEIDKPYILIAEGKIQDDNKLIPILEKVTKEQRGLVIIAEDFDRSVPELLLKNMSIKAIQHCCLIKYNFTGETKKEMMLDLCAVTGATQVEKIGDKLENIALTYLGECERIVIGEEDTTIIKGRNSKDLIESRITDAKSKIENSKHIFIKQNQERRLARLSGKIAMCYVGGNTEIEISEKKDRIDDSIRATKAAMEEGLLPGGGSALARCVYDAPSGDEDFKAGYKIVMEALLVPISLIYNNSTGNQENVPIKNLTSNSRFGYNAKTEKFEDMVDAGIIDPFKVVRVCVENAVSGAIQVLTAETLIVSDNN